LRCSKRSLVAAAIALAACGRSEDLLPPAPTAVVPTSAHTTQPVRISIRGDHFNLFGERHLGRGTALDAGFQATLGGVPLTDVRWVDNQTLEAVVPVGLAGEGLDLVLDGPTGHAVLPGAFRASAIPPAALAVSVAAPPQVESAAQFQVSVTIANTGNTSATGIRPSLSGPGLSFSPSLSDFTLDAGSNTTVVFLASSSIRGPATFGATAVGIDAFSGETVKAQGSTASAVLSPAALRSQVYPLPATVTVGQQFTLELDATNEGDADADAVTMGDPGNTGAGNAIAVANASPPQPIPAGQSRNFSWTYLASGAGEVSFYCSGSGTDLVTGAALPFSASWPTIVVQTPAALTSVATVRSALSVGNQTTLQLDVTNEGDALAFAVVPTLEIAGTGLQVLTSPAAQNVPGHETRNYSWTLAARSPGVATLSLQARGIEANTGAAVSTAPRGQPVVSVQAPAQLAGKAIAPAVVSTAQSFAISLEVSNPGEASAGTVSASATCTGAGNLALQSSPAPVILDGGQTRTMSWTFLASAAGKVDCSLSAGGADANDGHAVSTLAAASTLVQRAALLEIRSVAVPAVVSRGQSFTATVLVANTGEAAASAVVASPDPPQAVASGGASAAANPSTSAQDIAGGGTASFVYTFVENGSGAGSLALHAGAFGTDVNSRATVSAQPLDSSPIAVQIPASIAVTRVSVPGSIDRRQQFSVAVEVTNTGGTAAVDVLPSPLPLSLTATGGAGASVVTSPSAATIPSNGSAVFTFGYVENGWSPGTLSFSPSASGLDANSGQPLLAPALPSAAIAVQEPALLVVSRLSAPDAVTRGQGFTLAATVVNTGQATARCVTAGPPSMTSSGGPAVQGGTAPGLAQIVPANPAVVPIAQTACAAGVDLAAGQSATFTWTLTENGSASGTITFSVGASGTDVNTDGNLSAVPASAVTRVVAPAQLAVTSRSAPGTITRGQHFTTTVVVSNLGQATAVNVHPTPLSPSVTMVSGAASATLTSPVPAAVTLAAGESATFAYDYLENGTSSGTLQLTAGATGTDANSSATVDAPAASSNISVLDAAQLALESFSIPAALSRGQAFSLAIRVRNVSSGTLTNVVPSSNPPVQTTTGLAFAAAPAQPALASLAPGAVATFTYPFVENGTGTGTIAFSGTVSAVDGGTGLAVSANATSTAAAVVQDPPALAVTSFSVPLSLSRGQTFTASLVVSNSGGATALGVVPDAPSLTPSGGAHATITASPAAQDIVRGASATFTWTMVEDGSAPGSLQVATRARGSDVNSPATPVASALASATAAVQEPGHLALSKMTVPATVSRGETFTVSVVVTNAGGAAVQAIAPDASSPSIAAGGGAGAPVLKSAAPGKTILNAGQSTTFSWTYQDASAAPGTLTFSATMTGADVNSGAALTATAASSSTSVQRPALLSIGSLTLASPLGGSSIDRGQGFTARLVVSNNGDATASNVLPSPLMPALLPTGAASATAPAAPTAVSIAGGTSATFTWTYVESGSGPGALQVSTGVAGTDANSAAPLTVAAMNSNTLAVVGAPVLAAQSFTLPRTLSRGQTFTASLTVANTGGSGVTVLPDPPALGTTGGAHATVTAAPAAIAIAAGGTATFVWTYLEDGSSPGTLSLTTRASGTDANTSSTLATASLSTAAATVQTAAALSVTAVSLSGPSGGLAIDRGQTATVTVSVQNTGATAALGVALSAGAVTATGGAAGSPGALPASRDIAPGQTATYTTTLAENGTGPGTLQVAFGALGTDANSGLNVGAPAGSSNALGVQTPGALSATLSAPPGALPGETFSVSFTVTNSGGGEIRALAPALAIDSSAASIASGPLSPPSTLPGGASTTYTWSLVAASSGTGNLTASFLGTATNTGTALSASAIAPLAVGEAALVANKPFGDNSTFANLFAYRGSLYAGPNAAGTGGARMQPDGTAREALSFTLNEDSIGVSNRNGAAGPYTSFGAAGCKANTLACGPDNENARGLFGAVSFLGDEWLIGAGALSADNFFRFYATNDAMTAPDFSYVDTSVTVSNGMRTATAAVVMGSKLYVGLLGTGGVRPGLVALTRAPAAPGIDATTADVENLQAENIPGIGKSAKVSLIDSMIVFNDRLYLFNNGGCARSSTAIPAAGSWNNCTPSGSFPTKTSVTTTKNGNLLPSDKAFPAVAIWNGRLFAARNTTAGPQLWMCDPGADGLCAAGDWQLVAANLKLDPNLSQFDDAGNKSISLLAATAAHLYVGFDNAAGVQIYRAQTATPIDQGDFAGAAGCNAAQHPAGCAGIGGPGLGAGATRFFDGKALAFPSGEQLFVAAGDGASAARLFRFAQ
jgi:hypothetical protein